MSLLNKLGAFWKFEESATPSVDETGRGNDLTWSNVVRTTGVFGYGLDSPGGGGYASCNQNSDIRAAAGQPFTIAGWFKPVFDVSRGFLALAGLQNNYRLGMQWHGSSYITFLMDVWHDGGTPVSAESGPYSIGDWFFVRGWIDPTSNEIGIQVNCDAPITAPFAYDVNQPQTFHPFFVGAGPSNIQLGTFYNYYGSIDSVGVWHKLLDTNEAALLCAGLDYPFGLCHYLAFGDYEFSETWYPAEDGIEWSPSVTSLVRDHGGRAIDFYIKPRRLLVKGGEIKGPFNSADLRTRIDAIRTALGGQPQNLYFNPDRYWRDVRVESFRNPYGPTHYCRIAADMEINFLARDPFQYAVLGSTDTWTGPTNAGTHAITAGGSVFARPSIAFVVGGAGAQTINWTLENTTTGEAFQLSGAVTGGDTITVDCLNMTVVIGAVNSISLFDGEFLTFDVGANSYTITIVSGSITSITTTWQDRYY